MPKLKKGQAALNDLFYSYKYRAKKKNYEFCLTKEEFKNLTSKHCEYCGIEPSHSVDRAYRGRKSRFNGNYIYNGLDRVDNTRGYTIDNVVPCCKNCNSMKGDFLSFDEMKVAMDAVLKFRENVNG